MARCLASIIEQTITDWRAWIVLDPCTDDTLRHIAACWNDKFDLTINDVDRFCTANTVAGINQAIDNQQGQDDIAAIVDADDLLYDCTVFETIKKAYKDNDNAVLTYGSFVRESTGRLCPVSQPYEAGKAVRTQSWHGSHLKTFRLNLWKAIPPQYLVDDDRQYYRYCDDLAYMTTMMELAGPARCLHISKPLYIYNDLNPASSWYASRDECQAAVDRIRARPPLVEMKDNQF